MHLNAITTSLTYKLVFTGSHLSLFNTGDMWSYFSELQILNTLQLPNVCIGGIRPNRRTIA